jgi:hypothetical protein
MDIIIHFKAGQIDAFSACALFEHTAEHVIADFADESGLGARLCEHCQNVAGSSAWICLENIVALIANAVLDKID